MRERIACSALGHTFLEKKTVTISLLLQRCYWKILIDYGFSVKELFEIVCVSERTIFRRMLKYDLKAKDFPETTVNQFDSDALSLANDFPFCGETMLREHLKGRIINDQRYRLCLLSRIPYLQGG